MIIKIYILQKYISLIFGPCRDKSVFRGLRTTKTNTSLRILISALVIRLLESIISRLAANKISIL